MAPPVQLQLFDAVLVKLGEDQNLVNEAIEVAFVDGTVAIVRYPLPEDDG